ncbi:MAG: C40 family peptidase [Oscillospiraceae bacterium]|nr:C40 family peptidase [Oscillospiraceae bacterium]
MTKLLSLLLAALMILPFVSGVPVYAEVGRLPDVSAEMCEAAYWTGGQDSTDLLAGPDEIEALNQRILDTPACMMTDMHSAPDRFDAQAFYRSLWASVLGDASGMMRSAYYDSEGLLVSGGMMHRILDNIGGEGASEDEELRFGICVRRSDLMWLPGDVFATDEPGDLNYNWYQLSGVRVNEPLLVKAVSEDGAYYYCDTDCCSGWLPAADVAICADRDEWLEAWDIPGDSAVVVTEGKIYLENTNVNPDSSDVMLTMGTVLRRIPDEEYDPLVTGRSSVHNYPVWLPVRQEDGSYGRVMALISQNRRVSEGYLPLTAGNILDTAFTMLGDTYGWGGMLHSADCSAYVRDIYRCFGLNLPRNTTWQSAMPVYRFDVTGMRPEEKEAVLDLLPPGAVLYFSGHEMLYLGHEDGEYYVVSAVSTVRDYESTDRLRIRSVAINTLSTKRMNGRTWLESLNTMLLPYLPQEANTRTLPVPVMQEGRTEDGTDMLLPRSSYALHSSHAVDGRQGIACEDGIFYVSDTATLSRYDGDWNLLSVNDAPFESLDPEVNHIGDIDVYQGSVYAGVENFAGGSGTNLQIAIYDAETLELTDTWAVDPYSGQTEISGIAVDPDTRSVWLCSWTDGDSSRYLYRYDLDSGAYLGRYHLTSAPQWLQGIAWYDGWLYLTADDGTADLGEPDHVYRCRPDPERSSVAVVLERTLDDVSLPGEVEGISFDRENRRMLISCNRGAQIVLGMPKGMYEGYDEEIHEVFVYDIADR